MGQARSARAINRTGKTRRSVTYSADRENEVGAAFIMSTVCLKGFWKRFLITPNGFKSLARVEKKTDEFEIVVK